MHFKIIEYWLCKKPLVLYSNGPVSKVYCTVYWTKQFLHSYPMYVSHSKSFNHKLAKLSLQNEFYALQKLKLSFFWYGTISPKLLKLCKHLDFCQ